MDLQAIFSDNQIAILGCFVALGVCGAIAGLSFQFGPAGRKSSGMRPTSDLIRPLHRPDDQSTEHSPRRAA